MEGSFIYLNSDVQNIIYTLVYRYRSKCIHDEYYKIHIFSNGEYVDMSNTLGYKVHWEESCKSYWLDGQFHREDGPAIKYTNGDKYWYYKGQRHRKDGPAIEMANGYKAWYFNGRCHRNDGPAIEGLHGYKEWLANGKSYYDEDDAFREDEWINGIIAGFFGGMLGWMLGWMLCKFLNGFYCNSTDRFIPEWCITGFYGIFIGISIISIKRMVFPIYWKYYQFK